MAIYEGIRKAPLGGATVTVDGEPLDPRNDLFNHSPDGFQWGYAGSGPAQLALAILAHHFRGQGMTPADADENAVKLHQAFKRKVIAGIAHDQWTLTTSQIAHTLKAIAAEFVPLGEAS